MSVRMWREQRAWINMGAGKTIRNTEASGFHPCPPAGLRIRMGAGFTRITTVGPGWVPSRGDGRRITTARGTRGLGVGLGGLERSDPLGTGGPRWSGSSDGAEASALASDSDSALDMRTSDG